MALRFVGISRVCFACVFFLFFLLLSSGYAKDITTIASIRARQEYNTNVLFRRAAEIDDYISTLTPGLKIISRTEQVNIEASAAADFLFYWDQTNLNTVNQRYLINGDYRFKERWSLFGNFGYVKDTTLDSQLEETGQVGIREDRKRFKAGAGLLHQLSERSDAEMRYFYNKTNFERPASVDTEFHSLRFSYIRRLKNQRDVIRIMPQYTTGTSDIWDLNDFTLNLGWDHPFSETLDLSLIVGGRYTLTDFTDEREDSNTLGGVADIKLKKNDERTTGFLGFSQRLRPKNNGELINVSRLYCGIDHLLAERLGAGFRGSIYYSQLDQTDAAASDDRWFFDLRPSLFYKVTENHLLRLAYSYAQENRIDLDVDPRKDRHRVWLSLDLVFPKKW